MSSFIPELKASGKENRRRCLQDFGVSQHQTIGLAGKLLVYVGIQVLMSKST
jgi:hypothetical protein